MPNLETVQEAIIALLESEMAQDCYEQAIPDSKTVRRNSAGQVVPYVAYQFGDLLQVGATSFVGPRYHNYVLPFSTQSVAASASIARRISNKITDVLLGYSSAHTGSIYKPSWWASLAYCVVHRCNRSVPNAKRLWNPDSVRMIW
jgi:hypothetical protein